MGTHRVDGWHGGTNGGANSPMKRRIPLHRAGLRGTATGIRTQHRKLAECVLRANRHFEVFADAVKFPQIVPTNVPTECCKEPPSVLELREISATVPRRDA